MLDLLVETLTATQEERLHLGVQLVQVLLLLKRFVYLKVPNIILMPTIPLEMAGMVQVSL